MLNMHAMDYVEQKFKFTGRKWRKWNTWTGRLSLGFVLPRKKIVGASGNCENLHHRIQSQLNCSISICRNITTTFLNETMSYWSSCSSCSSASTQLVPGASQNTSFMSRRHRYRGWKKVKMRKMKQSAWGWVGVSWIIEDEKWGRRRRKRGEPGGDSAQCWTQHCFVRKRKSRKQKIEIDFWFLLGFVKVGLPASMFGPSY